MKSYKKKKYILNNENDQKVHRTVRFIALLWTPQNQVFRSPCSVLRSRDIYLALARARSRESNLIKNEISGFLRVSQISLPR